MSKVSHKPGTFICPSGFVELQLANDAIELDEDEELCLIRTPIEFDVSLLHKRKISLTGSNVIKASDERCFECTALDSAQTNLTHINALIPKSDKRGQIVQVSRGFQRQMVVSETFEFPDFEELHVFQHGNNNVIEIPRGLGQRFLPFGSDEPVVSRKGPKKSQRTSAIESELPSPKSDKRISSIELELQSPKNNKTRHKKSKASKWKASSSIENDFSERSSCTDETQQWENQLNDRLQNNPSKKNDRVGSASESSKKVAKNGRKHHDGSDTDSKKCKKHSSQNEDEFKIGRNSSYPRHSKKYKLKQTLSQTSTDNANTVTETPKKKKKHFPATIKQEVTPEAETSHTSLKKRKKMKKIEVKIEYPDLCSSDN